MRELPLLRILIVLAGLMGATGIILAAAATHQSDAARLGPASSMLLFHALAVIATAALAGQGIINVPGGLLAAFGFVAAAGLFAGDLASRHFVGFGLFPFAAPIGGSLLIACWLVLAVAAAWPRRS